MEMAAVDEDVDHIARNCLQDFVGIDLLADDRLCRDEGSGSPGDDDVVAGFEDAVEARLDIGSLPHDSLDDSAAADFLFDVLDRASRGGRDPVGARLEFAIVQIFTLWRVAAGKLRLQLRRLRLQIDPHQFRCDKRHVQERENIAEDIGDGVSGCDVCFLLLQSVAGQADLRERSGGRADDGGLRQPTGGKSRGRARIELEREGKYQNEDETRAAEHERHDDLRQGADAQGGEELGAGPVADREHEQAEQKHAQQRRECKGSELTDEHGHHQDAGCRSD